MAGILTSNSPAQGSIAWRQFSITIGDDVWTFPAGNTNKKLVWWIFGATTLTTGDALPTNLTEQDCLVFANRGGFAINATTATALNGDLIVPGTVIAEAIAADAIKAVHIDSDAVTADAIGAGEIYAEHLSAGAITTSKLSVGTVSDNLVANGSFEDITNGTIEGWTATTISGGTLTPMGGVSSSGSVAIEFNATTTSANIRMRQAPDKLIPVSATASRRWYVSARMGATVATSKGMYLRILWYDANKVATGAYADIISNAALATTFDVKEGQVVPPATARYMGIELLLVAPSVVTKAYVDEVTAREVIVSAAIGDEQITTPLLKAGAVVADKIASNSISAKHLTIGDFTNLLSNPTFSGSTLTTPSKEGWASAGTAVLISDHPISGNGCVLEYTGNGSVQDTTHMDIPCKPGDRFYFEVYVRKTVQATSVGTLGFQGTSRYNNAGIGYPSFGTLASNTMPLGTWEKITGTYEVPPAVYSLQPRLSVRNQVTDGKFQFAFPIMRRMNGGELLVDGAVTATHITASESLSAKAAQFMSLGVDKLTVTGSAAIESAVVTKLWAEVVNAKLITSNMLAVGDFTNYVDDADFKGVGWTLGAGISITDTSGAPGKALLFAGGGGNRYSYNTNRFAVAPGDWLHYGAKVQNSGTGTVPRVHFRIEFFDSAGVYVSLKEILWAPGTWSELDSTAEVPANCYEARIVAILVNATGGTAWFANPFVRRMNKGELIVDGSILAKHIDVTSLTADTAKMNTLRAGVLTVDSVKATAIDVANLVATSAKITSLRAGILVADAVKATHIDVANLVATSAKITALRAGVLTVDSVKATSIDVANLVANSAKMTTLKAGIITADAFSGKTFTGGTFTGATFQTEATANRGIKLDATNGFVAYTPTGVRAVDIGPAGTAKFIGDFSTGETTGAYTRIANDNYAGGGTTGIVMKPMPGSDTSIQATSQNNVSTGALESYAQYSTYAGGVTGRARLNMDSSGTGSYVYLAASTGTGAPPVSLTGTAWKEGITNFGKWELDGDLYLDTIRGRTANTPLQLFNDTNIRIVAGSGAFLSGEDEVTVRGRTLGSSTTKYAARLQDGTYDESLGLMQGSGGALLRATTLATVTTTNSANMWTSTAGYIYRSTSAAKYKLAVKDMPVDYEDKILTLRATTWFDKTQAENIAAWHDLAASGEAVTDEDGHDVTQSPDKLRRVPGMIAEEVEAAGLEEFVVYGEDGEVEGLMYDRLGVSLIPIVARLRDRVEALERALATN